MPCSLLYRYQCYRRNCCLHLQDTLSTWTVGTYLHGAPSPEDHKIWYSRWVLLFIHHNESLFMLDSQYNQHNVTKSPPLHTSECHMKSQTGILHIQTLTNISLLSDTYYVENQSLYNLKLFISLAATNLYFKHTLKNIKMYIFVYKLAVCVLMY
jgi:hypothetical protein